MSTKINMYITPRGVSLDIKDGATELDMVLALGALFDRISPNTKKMVLEKFANIVDLEIGAMLKPKEDNK